jgi:L-threonylcarbamoyladenylate synthase
LITPPELQRVARVVREGGVIAYPTEAVFGLGCDPLNAKAVERLIGIKGRPAAKGLILIAAEPEQLEPFILPLPAQRREEILASWPGPVTWVLPARPTTAERLTGGRPTLAVRVTAHPLAAALCRACAMPLVSTSANRSGEPPATTAREVEERLGRLVDYVVPGACGQEQKPSTIRVGLSGAVLRG